MKYLLILSLLVSIVKADEYIVVETPDSNYDAKNLTLQVNAKLKEGYELTGGVCATNYGKLYQAMIKKEKK